MLMGAGPEQHGITSNGWEKDDFILPPVVSGTENIFPTIFSVIKNQNSDSEIGAVYHWGGFGRLFEKSCVDIDINGKTEYETTEIASKIIKDKKPEYLFIHLDHVDHAGHEYGHGTKKYYKSVEIADELIGKIVNAIRQAGIFENTTILVTADHGGIGYGHGGETIDEIEIPFILYGHGIKKGYRINHPVYTYDNAATAVFVLGYDQPYAWIGRAVKSAFVGYKVPKSSYVKMMLPAPTIYPKKKLYDPAGGLFIDDNPKLKIESEIDNSEIRYTLDGTSPTENSELYTKPINLKKSVVVSAKVFDKDKNASSSSVAYFRIVKSNSNNGISYKYFEIDNLKMLPSFVNLKPEKIGKCYEFRYGNIPKRKENFAIEFNSKIKIEKKGEYKFYTYSDDGSQLLINDRLIVDNDGDHGTKERSGSINLDAGFHNIKVTYFNGGGGSWLDVFYKGPNIPKQIISPEVLFVN